MRPYGKGVFSEWPLPGCRTSGGECLPRMLRFIGCCRGDEKPRRNARRSVESNLLTETAGRNRRWFGVSHRIVTLSRSDVTIILPTNIRRWQAGPGLRTNFTLLWPRPHGLAPSAEESRGDTKAGAPRRYAVKEEGQLANRASWLSLERSGTAVYGL
jgi:hypothetical protein